MESNEFWEEYSNSMDDAEQHSFADGDAFCPVIKLGRMIPARNARNKIEVLLSTMTVRLPMGGQSARRKFEQGMLGMTYDEWCEYAKIKYPGWIVMAVIEEQDFDEWTTCEECAKLDIDDPWRTG